MLRRNDAVNVPALAGAYVQSFQGQLLLNERAVEAASLQGRLADQGPPQQGSGLISAAATSDEQQLGAAVSLKTFKDLLDDLRSQLKEVNELDDKVRAGSV